MPDIIFTLEFLPDAPQVTLLSGKQFGQVHHLETKDGETQIAVFIGIQETCTTEKLRQTGGRLVNWLIEQNFKKANLDVSVVETLELADGLEGFLQGVMLGGFRFERHKTLNPSGEEITLGIQNANPAGAGETLERVRILAGAQILARDWAHEPPNVINPITLAARCQSLARMLGLRCTVLDDTQLEAMGAGAIVAVGKASATPARMIILEYAGDGRKVQPIVVVGKAITFDTGGYTIKTRDGMVGMKFDKCGAMAVVGIMQAVAQLKLPMPVVGMIAAAENMIAGNAYRPNDIIKTLSSKTVEIISADAEGRMVLADALTYACRNYQPRAIIDLATLTGGVGVALGNVRAGMMTNDDALAEALFLAGEQTHERLWRLPLDDEYLDLIKGNDSDFKNSGGAKASAIIGGIFLKQFLEGEVPWAHLDIASTGFTEEAGPYHQKGATGFGVRLITSYISQCG